MDPIAIYEDLKEKIIWLEHKPESTFNLTELAEHYGVSRNPITLALTRLDAEDWVARHGSHFVVSPLSLSRIREITEIRSLMEIQAYMWALRRITPEEIDEVGKLKKEIRKLSKSATNQEIVRLDLKFHRLLYQAAKNSELSQLLERLLSHYLRFWLSIPRKIDREAFFIEHSEIIDAVLAKDEEQLRAATSEHIKKSVEEIIGSF
jgi:DNA-binding GntR family transcriptional regulator